MEFLVDNKHWDRKQNTSTTVGNSDNNHRIRGSNNNTNSNDEATVVSSIRYNHSQHSNAYNKPASRQPLYKDLLVGPLEDDIDDQKRSRNSLYANRFLTHQHSHPPLLHRALLSNLVNLQATRDDSKLTCSHNSLPPTFSRQHSSSEAAAMSDYGRQGGPAAELLVKLPLDYRRQHRPLFRAQRSLGNVRNGPVHGTVQRSSSSSAADDLHKGNQRAWNVNRMELQKRLALADEHSFSPVKWHHIYRDTELRHVLNKGKPMLLISAMENVVCKYIIFE